MHKHTPDGNPGANPSEPWAEPDCLLMMQAHRHATSCTILCTVSEAAHAALPSTMLGESAYTEYLAALNEASMAVHRACKSCLPQGMPPRQTKLAGRRGSTVSKLCSSMACAGRGRGLQEDRRGSREWRSRWGHPRHSGAPPGAARRRPGRTQLRPAGRRVGCCARQNRRLPGRLSRACRPCLCRHAPRFLIASSITFSVKAPLSTHVF